MWRKLLLLALFLGALGTSFVFTNQALAANNGDEITLFGEGPNDGNTDTMSAGWCDVLCRNLYGYTFTRIHPSTGKSQTCYYRTGECTVSWSKITWACVYQCFDDPDSN